MRFEGTSEAHRVQPHVQAGPPNAGCPGPPPDGFWVSPRVETPQSLGNLYQCSITLKVKNCFLLFRGILLCFSLYPLPIVLSLSTTEKSLNASSSQPPFSYLYTLIRFLLSLLFSKLNTYFSQPFPIGEMLQSLHHLRGLSLDSLHVFPVLRIPELDIVFQVLP